MYRSIFFLTSALAGGVWSALRPCRFSPGERAPDTHFIGGRVDPRAGLDDVEKRKLENSLAHNWNQLPAVQHVARRFTD
jgi:hypothetical protein